MVSASYLAASPLWSTFAKGTALRLSPSDRQDAALQCSIAGPQRLPAPSSWGGSHSSLLQKELSQQLPCQRCCITQSVKRRQGVVVAKAEGGEGRGVTSPDLVEVAAGGLVAAAGALETAEVAIVGVLDGGATKQVGGGEGASAAALALGAGVAAVVSEEEEAARRKRLERRLRRESERASYQIAAIASSVGFTTLAAAAVYHRFAWQIPAGGSPPVLEMVGTFTLAVGALVGMEFWARWAHRALWHDSLWSLHESHHLPRDGPFEANDIFAIINAVPAIALLAYGFFNPGLVPGLCFGAGLGITMFGMAYMFVHDGLVHRRFPVGPVADVPYLQKVAAAHQLHHADKYKGVPWGLFLGPEELAAVGGTEDLATLVQSRRKQS